MGLRAAFDDKQSFLSEVNVEKTCLKLQSSLNELKDGKNNDRNVKYHWSYLSCSKILSYNSMEKELVELKMAYPNTTILHSNPSVMSPFWDSDGQKAASSLNTTNLDSKNMYMKRKKHEIIGKCLLMKELHGIHVLRYENWTALRCSELVNGMVNSIQNSESKSNHYIKSSTKADANGIINRGGQNRGRGPKRKRKSGPPFLPVESLGRLDVASSGNSVSEEWCESIKEEYAVKPLQSWGRLPESLQIKWKSGLCDAHFSKARMAEHPLPQCNDSQIESKELIAIMAATTTRKVLNPTPGRLSLFNMLLPSLMRSVECGYRYVYVLGYDVGDSYYDTDEGMAEVLRWFSDNVERIMSENGIELKILPVRVNNTLKKPGPVFIEMARRAYEMKADYFFRINDDTELVSRWPSSFVSALGSIHGRVGVVGPFCRQGNQQILTHDFVHRTHMEIFEMNYYPPELVDWWMDDWISFVYGESRSFKVSNVEVLHHTGAHGRRYEVDRENSAKVGRLVKEGRIKIRNWLIANKVDDHIIKSFDNDKYQTIGGTFPLKLWN